MLVNKKSIKSYRFCVMRKFDQMLKFGIIQVVFVKQMVG